MIVNILDGILNGQLTTEEILTWLTTDKPNDVLLPDLVQTDSSRTEFVLFFLDYLRKQCHGIIQTGSLEGEPVTVAKKKIPKTPTKTPNRTPLSSSNRSEGLNLTCRTSTPLKNPPIPGQSHANGSINFSSPLHASPIYRSQNFIGSSFDHPSTSSRLDNSCINASIDSSLSNSSAMSLSFVPVSPLYSGSTQEALIPLDTFHHTENEFPAIGQHPQNYHRNKKRNTNTSKENQSKSSNDKQNNSGQKKKTIKLGDFLVTSSTKLSTKSNSRNQSEISVDNTSGENVKENSSQKKSGNLSRNRRIKPTKLETTVDEGNNQNNVFGVISRPETKNLQFLEARTTDKSGEIKTFEAERELLKLERQKPKNDSANEIATVPEPKPTKPLGAHSSIPAVIPELSLVHHPTVVDKLADIYGTLIRNHLVPNIMTELYFVMTLITSQFKANEQMSLQMLKETMGCKDLEGSADEEAMPLEIKYLDSPHNCIYFATNVLHHQKDLLIALDRATIKLLCDNQHIGSFKPELKNYLEKLYDEKVQESNQFKKIASRTINSNVCFQIETDNQENFPSKTAFSEFRKQRDLFYEYLKKWEDHHQTPRWCFFKTLAPKIKSLLLLHDDAVNYYHLARLFKSQLLASCHQHSSEDPIDDETLSLLKSLKSMNLEKFKQLQGRFVTPLSSEGIVPLPSFPGIQEFYRDFLLASSNVKFNSILESCFIQSITDLNSTIFTISELESREKNVDETTKQNYLMCISSLRLLSKFLGFLVSIPFQSQSVTLVVWDAQISLRRQVNPSLDLQGILVHAFINGKLTLTVPWMVEYLAVLDPVALRLPYYTKLCQILYYIYRNCHSLTGPKESLLITFTLGRLFELPNFPKDLYFTWQSNFSDKRLKDQITMHFSSSEEFEDSLVPLSTKKLDVPLDKLGLIDDRAIITCCPFLKEFKILLISGNSNFGTMNRHITPVSTQLSQPSSENKAKTLQLRQEDAFLHGQPNSVRKTVDFVSEIIASNSVKEIYRETIPSIKLKYFTMFDTLAAEKSKNSVDLYKHKEKQVNQQWMNSENSPDLIVLITKELRDHCHSVIPKNCKKKCTEALTSLLSEDTHPAVKEMCVKICMRLSIGRIDQWLDFYINDAVNTKQIHSEYLSFSPTKKVEENTEHVHNPSAPSPTQIIELMRDSMWELIEKNGKWSLLTEENVLEILRGLKKTLHERKDLQAYVEKNIYILSVDYAIHLIGYYHQLFTDTVLDAFIDVWRNYETENEKIELFRRILSCRNIQWLRSTGDSQCWKKFGKLINRLLSEKLLRIGNFSDQCVAIFRKDLPGDVTRLLPECLNEAIQGCKPNDEKAEKIRMMLRWISGVCGELDGNSEGGYGEGATDCKPYGLGNPGLFQL
ncbi:codanin-1 isoform X2 [Diachasmimorpha longicaudata]|uniref:codanin-1 isoform X2 n=1 Tax=Diachasmimorpha longicaudata TaxID=58733 RepID=UPI0030B8A265